MKKPMSLSIAVMVGVVAGLLLFFAPMLCRQSSVFCRGADIDINSGDTRHTVHVFSLCVKNEIQESDLSREVRRLGIDIPPSRAWKRTFESHLVEGQYVNWKYGHVVTAARRLLSIFDEARAPDEERRAALEGFMASLRMEDADQTLWIFAASCLPVKAPVTGMLGCWKSGRK